jgi:hypothetical protein
MRQVYRDCRERFAGLIRAAQTAGEARADLDAEAAAIMLSGAIDGLLLQYWLEPSSFDPRRTPQQVLAALFGEIAPND